MPWSEDGLIDVIFGMMQPHIDDLNKGEIKEVFDAIPNELIDAALEKLNAGAPRRGLDIGDVVTTKAKIQTVSFQPRDEKNAQALDMLRTGGHNAMDINRMFTGLSAEVKGAGLFDQHNKRKMNLQQFFTTTEIAYLIKEMLQIPENATVFDPTCGSGRLFTYVPNQHLCHGIEKETIAFNVARGIYPDAQIINDNTMYHVFDNEFDYSLSNPPFNLTFEDEFNLYKFKGAYGTVTSQYAVLEGIVRATVFNGYIALIVPEKFYHVMANNKDIIEWLQGQISIVAEIHLPEKGTCDNTKWPMMLYILRRQPDSDYWFDSGKSFTYTMNSAEDVDKVLDGWRRSEHYDEVVEYANTRHSTTPTLIEIKEAPASKLDNTLMEFGKGIASMDMVTLDAEEDVVLESFAIHNLRAIPNNLVADLKMRNIHSQYKTILNPFTHRFENEFLFKYMRWDNIATGDMDAKSHPLPTELRKFDIAIQVSDRLMDLIRRKSDWYQLQNTPFEQWIDPNDSGDWQIVDEDVGFRSQYSELYALAERELDKMAAEPMFTVPTGKDDGSTYNWIETLYGFQREDVLRTLFRASHVNASMMGTGKTRTSIASVELKRRLFGFDKILYVVPSKLIPNWKEEFEDQLKVGTLQELRYVEDLARLKDGRYYITSYGTLGRSPRSLSKSEKAKRTRAKKKGKKRQNPMENPSTFHDGYPRDDPYYDDNSDEAEYLAWDADIGILEGNVRSNPKALSKAEQADKEAMEKLEKAKKTTFSDLIATQFDIVVTDEAHYMSNPVSNRTIGVSKLEPLHWIFLTGTPIANRVRGFFSILDIGWKSGSAAFPYSNKDFIEKFVHIMKYTKEYEQSMGYGKKKKRESEVELPIIDNMNEFITLINSKLLRRQKHEPDVAQFKQFPKPIITLMRITPSAEEIEFNGTLHTKFAEIFELMQAGRLTNERVEEFKRDLGFSDYQGTDTGLMDEEEAKATNKGQALVLAMIHKLRMASAVPQSERVQCKLATFEGRGLTPLQKDIIDSTTERVKRGDRVLIICEFMDQVKLLAGELEKKKIRTLVATGSQSIPGRFKMVSQIEDHKADVMVATIGVMDVGLNMPSVNHTIIASPNWNYSAMEQAWNRTIRPKSKGDRTVHIMVNTGMMDEYCWLLADMKKYHANAAIDRLYAAEEPEWANWAAMCSAFIDSGKPEESPKEMPEPDWNSMPDAPSTRYGGYGQ